MNAAVKETLRVWSAYQLAIFRDIAEAAGHTVVRARAGVGKTSTIMEGMKYVPAGCTVLMCAFNKSIAEELKARAPQGVEVSTLHSYGYKAVMRKFGKAAVDGYKVDNLARVAYGNKTETIELRKSFTKAVSLAKAFLIKIGDHSALDDLMDEFGIDLSDEKDQVDEVGSDVEAKRDLFRSKVFEVLEWCKSPTKVAVPTNEAAGWRSEAYHIQDNSAAAIDFDDMIWLPIVHNLTPRRYDRVFIDETQDLNACQIELALRACAQGGRICAVGDEKQAIYGFRGADSRALENIVKRLHAKVLPLSVTYRCARAIVREANRVVADFEAAPDAVEGLVAPCDEETMIARVQAGDFILSRTNAPLVTHCMALIRQGRRASIQGRDVGSSLATFVKKSGSKSIEDFRAHVDSWRGKETERLLGKGKGEREVQSIEDQAETLLALSEGVPSVAQLLATIEALFSDNDDANKVVLSSTHKAKGLERDRVFLLADTYMRRPETEEQNLYYVAVTRARRELYLVRRKAEAR
jgi:superfamily I DNA/RNA helicase